jgi:hypothetical protein
VLAETQRISVQQCTQNFPIPKGPHSPSSASFNSFLERLTGSGAWGAVRDVLI